jgi:nitrogen fixation-related uncharacterized protein
MNVYVILLVIVAIAVAALIVYTFVWANRNKPDLLDEAEQKIRDYKKGG